MWKQFSHGVAKCDQSCLVALVFYAKLFIKSAFLLGPLRKTDKLVEKTPVGQVTRRTGSSGVTDIVSAGAETAPKFSIFVFFLRVCSLIGVNAAVTQLSRPGSGSGDDILCASAEALVFSGDWLFSPVECTFSLLSLDDEVAMKRLPTKWQAG